MNLEDPKAEEYLETIYLKSSQLSAKACELRKVLKGEVPEGTNPFALPKELIPLKREIDNAWDALNAIRRVRSPAAERREEGIVLARKRSGRGERQLGVYDG